MVADPKPNYNLGNVRIYYDTQVRRLDVQFAAKRAMDGKLIGVFTSATAILAFVATLLSSHHKSRLVILALLLVAAIAYLFVAWFTFQGYKTADLLYGPDGKDVRPLLATHSEEVVWKVVADRYDKDFQKNLTPIQRKADNLQRGFMALLIQVAALFAATAIALAST